MLNLYFFLSKCLSSTKLRYWSIELKVADLVWIIRRIYHMIATFNKITESAKSQVTVFINHSAITSIIKQTKLSSSNTNKLNLRLIRASIYLSQFDMNVRHKSDKLHVVSDALFRLTNHSISLKSKSTLNEIYFSNSDFIRLNDSFDIYHTTLVEMSDDFKARLKTTYRNNKHWTRVLKIIFNLNDSTREDLRFKLRDELIYYINELNERERLCISKAMRKKIFQLTHDEQSHEEFHRTYDRLIASMYIRKLSRRLQKYIRYCSECQVNQTKRHSSYEILKSIQSLAISFHTITINFVLALSTTMQSLNNLLTIIDKFSKKILLLSKKDTYFAVNWANLVLMTLMKHD